MPSELASDLGFFADLQESDLAEGLIRFQASEHQGLIDLRQQLACGKHRLRLLLDPLQHLLLWIPEEL